MSEGQAPRANGQVLDLRAGCRLASEQQCGKRCGGITQITVEANGLDRGFFDQRRGSP
ncbi:hypothetical protein [Glutamicibacter soli]